ncbi:MAG: hypothetical protein ABIY52_18525 [Gemmatimonadaceae bacterium]
MLRSRLVLFGVLVVAGAYVFANLRTGWMPFDDGMIAQSAERVMHGQLPHRDFDEPYTGGLSVVNATAFRLLGTTLWTLRVVLFAAFMAWVPAVFYLASRFVRPLAAGALTLLAVVWSVPNYNAAMPSWYNLFLATFGVAALFRYLEAGSWRWLFVAGLAGGLSVIVKVVGLYYLAGVLLFLVFHAHARARSAVANHAVRGPVYAAFVSASLALFVAALVILVRHQFRAPEVVLFVLPGALLALLLARNEWAMPAGASRERFVLLARMLLPVLAGAAIPVALFLIPYVKGGAVSALTYGLFVLPMRRFAFASFLAPDLSVMLALVPFALLVIGAHRAGSRAQRPLAIMLAVVALVALLVSGRSELAYRLVWNAVRSLVPALTVIAVAVLWRAREADARDPLLRPRTMAIVCITVLCSLVQFPFAVPIYFCYVAPLVVLMALALRGYATPQSAAVPGVLVAFLILFAVVRVNGTPLQSMGVAYQPPFPSAPLKLARGGVDVPNVHADAYNEVIPLLAAHARGGYTWASPDTPEIYFLANLQNPTRSFYDFMDDPVGYEPRTLAQIDAHGVTAVVINRLPFWSKGITRGMYREIATRFPQSRVIGPFDVRWRE